MAMRMPVDARYYMRSLPWQHRLRCRAWFLLADLFGFWRRPVRMDPDPVRFPKGMLAPYWFYKAGKPIVRPVRGSGLEEYFEAHREQSGPLLPADFQKERCLRLSAVGDLMKLSITPTPPLPLRGGCGTNRRAKARRKSDRRKMLRLAYATPLA